MSSHFEFIDFGAGRGGSFEFASSCMAGKGLAIDKSEEAVRECSRLGYPAEQHDILEFSQRNIAQAAFAIDVMQELPGQQAFRAALINMIRAATHFIVIQHPYYDLDANLAAKQLLIEEHFDKKTIFKPTLADYLGFLESYSEILSLSGLSVCNSGKIIAMPTISSKVGDQGAIEIPKNLRVIFGRKSVARFRKAQYIAKTGKDLFTVERQ